MLTWKKTGRTITAAGTDILYEAAGAENTGVTIESRKRHIPHANGIGTWDHTTYHVLHNGRELSTKHSLRDAKEYAEALINKTEVDHGRSKKRNPDPGKGDPGQLP